MEIDTAIEEATPSTQVAEPIGTDEQANVPVWSYPGEIWKRLKYHENVESSELKKRANRLRKG